jgi:proline iminopeptidase
LASSARADLRLWDEKKFRPAPDVAGREPNDHHGMRFAVFLVLGLLVAPLAAVVGAFAVAAVLPSPIVFLGAGAALCAGASLLAWRLAWRRWSRLSVGGAVAQAGLIGALFAFTVLAPMSTVRPAPAPAGTQFWPVPDGHLAVLGLPATGPAKATPVIFLHGGPGTPGEGIPVGGAELAAAGFDVYAYDQIGTGRSTRLRDVRAYTVARHVADLEAVRRRIGAERVILIGRSWGGSLAAQYLAAHPTHVAAAVFVTPGVLWGGEPSADHDSEPWGRLKGEQRRRHDELISKPRILAASLLMNVNPRAAHALVGDREADSWMHRVASTGVGLSSCRGVGSPPHGNLQGFYVNQFTSRDFAKIPDPRPALRRVRGVRTLVLGAQCDYIRARVGLEYRDVLRARYLRVPGAGHTIASDRPRLLAELLRNFALGQPLPPVGGE